MCAGGGQLGPQAHMGGHPVAMGHTMLGPNGMVSHMVPSQDYHHAGGPSLPPQAQRVCLLPCLLPCLVPALAPDPLRA